MYMNFRQNFSNLARKKFTFAISEKTLAETVNCIPKGLRKGNPFHGPFAQLSTIEYHYQDVLVGGFNPFENISQIGWSSQVEWTLKNIWNHHLVYECMKDG